MKMKKLFKPAVVALVLSAALSSGSALAATGESRLTPTMKGWAPYLPSVGTQVVGRADGTTKPLKIGDVVEVPTYLLNSKYYTYADGNTTQDKDEDNAGRVRPGQFTVDIAGQQIAQKVSVHWYVVEPKDPAVKNWAPDGTSVTEFNDPNENGSWITDWADVIAVPVTTESYTMPGQGSKSLAVKVPVEASGKRIGFIIVPESQTGDPFRGQPLKVPDLNFIWEQPQPQGPGDQCDLSDVTDSDALSNLDTCLIDPTNPTVPNPPEKPILENPGNGGGDVVKANYIVTIHYLPKGATEANPKTDPILGTQAHPHPLVNSTYYADIKVLGKETDPEDPPIYRDLDNSKLPDSGTVGEVDSISWNFYRGDLDPALIDAAEANTDTTAGAAEKATLLTNAFIATAKQIESATNNRTGELVDADGRKYFSFKTQVDNVEANTTFGNAFNTLWKWDDVAINGENSEQRTRLRVTFNYDENVTVTPPTP
ncbi:hypothetical protein [Thorsellia anophelis]|uniref:Uncharacterized protein n=1 Tax=Thorsellia anophelis DSM 18579 TaxID=1123402 RepID=A0A1I0ALM5_9GAMM|nr:hypothetical protein [Thorsellia anophelis]SES95222.1 hypothetical protein SAMN02583745_00969 [Thorsellia anophelis DSM 18579]